MDPIVKKDTEVIFKEDRILFKEDIEYRDIAVQWVNPIMKRVSEILTEKEGHILDIGLGMGVLFNYVSRKKFKTYTIFEINEKIYEKGLELLEKVAEEHPYKKSTIRLILGDWHEHLDMINSNKWDAIHYDAVCPNGYNFRKLVVDKSLKPDGIFSYFFPSLDYGYHKSYDIDVFGYGKDLSVEFVDLEEEHLDENGYLKDCNFHTDYFATMPYVRYPLKNN